MDEAEVPLHGARNPAARLILSQLPNTRAALSVDERSQTVVREGATYRYDIRDCGEISRLDPAELFDRDDASFRTGRLTPGEAVGRLAVTVTTGDGERYRGIIDVRCAKLGDEAAFATMLAELAERSVEALHQGFSPSAGQYAPAGAMPARLLYQRFAVLSALLKGSELGWALDHVIALPHRAWETSVEPRSPGRPLRGSSRLSTQLARPGPRVPTPRGPLPSLPATVMVHRTTETLDTVPNRYLRFVLEQWRALAAEVLRRASSLGGAAKRRGIVEAQQVVEQLDELLGAPLFREVQQLSILPGDNQVLRRREGYRQIFAAAELVESSLGLDLVDIEDPFLVSRRSIATLYEYWTFVRLAEVVATVWNAPTSAKDLFRASSNGMSLVLAAGATSRLEFATMINGEEIRADLFFNQEFRSGSWTRPMRPDASLFVRKPGEQEAWLHFDAKYKVDWRMPFDTGEPDDEEEAERLGVSKRVDLLKMHAYRDAIRASAGSYVLFPGSDAATYVVDDAEFLPGLGAFPMRPDRAGEDSVHLASFLERVLQHVASPGTRHRRATYWTTKTYTEKRSDAPQARPPIGSAPPADTGVMVGYVRSETQWEWIGSAGLYNVRSGERRGAVSEVGPLLDAPLLLLHGRAAGSERRQLFRRTGQWRAVTHDGMRRLRYPDPRGDAYLVAPVEEFSMPEWIGAIDLQVLRPSSALPGAPFATSWLELALSIQE